MKKELKKTCKKNCWEFMACGREQGGKNADKDGVCPASLAKNMDGFNQGNESGRACWLVAGTFCNNQIQGSYAQKRKNCMGCSFYKQVQSEEKQMEMVVGSLNVAIHTHVGLVRKTNQDRYFTRELDDGSALVVIADGMGGEAGGDYAAEITAGKLSGITSVREHHELEELENHAIEMDRFVSNLSEEDPDLFGMGTTLICLLIREDRLYWVHVGDCRLYLMRDKKLKQLTRDQSFARFLLEEGEITEKEMETHYSTNILDQSIGCGFCEPETGEHDFRSTDKILMCTDGLHGKLKHPDMEAVMNESNSMTIQLKHMVDASLQNGGEDNITVISVESNPELKKKLSE